MVPRRRRKVNIFGRRTSGPRGGRKEGPQGRKGSVNPLALHRRGTITKPSVGRVDEIECLNLGRLVIRKLFNLQKKFAPKRHRWRRKGPPERSVALLLVFIYLPINTALIGRDPTRRRYN